MTIVLAMLFLIHLRAGDQLLAAEGRGTDVYIWLAGTKNYWPLWAFRRLYLEVPSVVGGNVIWHGEGDEWRC